MSIRCTNPIGACVEPDMHPGYRHATCVAELLDWKRDNPDDTTFDRDGDVVSDIKELSDGVAAITYNGDNGYTVKDLGNDTHSDAAYILLPKSWVSVTDEDIAEALRSIGESATTFDLKHKFNLLDTGGT